MKTVHVKEKLALDGALEMSYQYRRVDMGESIENGRKRAQKAGGENEKMHVRHP